MENLKDIQTLVAKAEQADEPDRALDVQVWHVFTPGATRTSTTVNSSHGLWPSYVIDETREANGRLVIVPSFTKSIDCALELVRQHYPDAGIILESGYRGPYSCCTIRRQDSAAFTTGSMMGQQSRPDDNMALAIIAAFLMAKEAEVQNVDDVEDDAKLAG